MRTEFIPLSASACPTVDDMAPLHPLDVPPPTPKRKARKRRPRGQKLAEIAIGTRMLPRDHVRLMSHLARTGEKPASFLRRAILALLSARTTTDHA